MRTAFHRFASVVVRRRSSTATAATTTPATTAAAEPASRLDRLTQIIAFSGAVFGICKFSQHIEYNHEVLDPVVAVGGPIGSAAVGAFCGVTTPLWLPFLYRCHKYACERNGVPESIGVRKFLHWCVTGPGNDNTKPKEV